MPFPKIPHAIIARHSPACLVALGLSCFACAPPVTRTTVHSVTVANVRQAEHWLPERGVGALAVQREGDAYVLQVHATRVCRVFEVEQRFQKERWVTGPNAGMLVGELVMIGAGAGIASVAWAHRDQCSAGDGSCDQTADTYGLVGLGLATAGTVALAVDLVSADHGEETTTRLGRAVPPHEAPCKNPTYQGAIARLVGSNVTLAGTIDAHGKVRLQVPESAWGESQALDLDVVIDGRVLGRVVLRKEGTCDGC